MKNTLKILVVGAIFGAALVGCSKGDEGNTASGGDAAGKSMNSASSPTVDGAANSAANAANGAANAANGAADAAKDASNAANSASNAANTASSAANTASNAASNAPKK